MAVSIMREVQPGEVPVDGGTAVQEDPDRPVFRGHGSDDYVCVTCGNLLAQAMDPPYMTRRVRIRCGRCRHGQHRRRAPRRGARRPRRGRVMREPAEFDDRVCSAGSSGPGVAMIKAELASRPPSCAGARARSWSRRSSGPAARPACGPAIPRSSPPTARSTGFVGGLCAESSVRLYALRAHGDRRAPAAAPDARRDRWRPREVRTGSTGRWWSTTRV